MWTAVSHNSAEMDARATCRSVRGTNDNARAIPDPASEKAETSNLEDGALPLRTWSCSWSAVTSVRDTNSDQSVSAVESPGLSTRAASLKS